MSGGRLAGESEERVSGGGEGDGKLLEAGASQAPEKRMHPPFSGSQAPTRTAAC